MQQDNINCLNKIIYALKLQLTFTLIVLPAVIGWGVWAVYQIQDLQSSVNEIQNNIKELKIK